MALTFEKSKRESWDGRGKPVTEDRYGSRRGTLENEFEKGALQHALRGKHYDRALDVGIGDGRLAKVYAPHVKRLLGIDISPEQLNYVEQNVGGLGIKVETEVCGDASKLEILTRPGSMGEISETGERNIEISFYEDWSQAERQPIESGQYDLVICTRVLQHVSDWKSAIAEQARVLKPGGDLLLMVYNRFSPYGLKKLGDHIFRDRRKGNFRNPIDIRRELKRQEMTVKYHSGAILSPLDLFKEGISDRQEEFARNAEKLTREFPFKFFGARQIILARKES
jgi:SAM-dependent methyltransferase